MLSLKNKFYLMENIIKKIKKYLRKGEFCAYKRGILFNPVYIIRSKLYESIEKNSSLLNWRLLDLWCGAKPYKELFSNVTNYIGVDIQVSWHSHNNSDVDIYYDGKNLPFENNSFDSFFSSEVFEHIFNLEEILKEIYRVLKPGWVWLITIPFAYLEHEEPYDFARYTSFWIKHLLENNGFKVDKIMKLWTFFETLLQLYIIWITSKTYIKTPIIWWIITSIIITPLNLLYFFFSWKEKSKSKYYLNNIIIIHK